MTKENQKPKIDLEEQLVLARKLLIQAETEAAFRRGIVQTLEQLHKGEPIILQQDTAGAPPPPDTAPVA
jgi:hypothetical protein